MINRREAPEGLHYATMARAASVAVILGGACWGQSELEFFKQQLEFGLRLCVAGEREFAAIGGRHEYVDHRHGGEFLRYRTRGEAGGKRVELSPQSHVRAVSQERDEDMRFDANLFLVMDRPDRQIAIEGPEGRLDLHQLQIELPEFGRVDSVRLSRNR